ncbi:MAG: glycosyltransferase [Deltaproteobacteria bacterium]|nr:glycosyltransferase [Deltaproteobacteria bacterium]
MDSREPLKLLMLASSYPRSKEDSSSVFLRHLAENLSRRGIKVHLLVPAYGEGGIFFEGGIKVQRFQYLPTRLQKLAYGSGILPNLKQKPWLWIEVPFFLIMMTYSLLRLLWKERPDLIHAHWLLPQGLVAVSAKLFYKAPVVATAHGSDVFALRGKLFDKLRRYVLRRSDAWTSNSRATAAGVGEEPSLPAPHILPMGVDVRQFQSGQLTKLRQNLPKNELVLLFVGRLVKQKGVDDLLQASTLLPSALRARTSLWVVGDGQDRGRLQEQAQTLGIDGKVRFWGQVNNDLLPDFYAAADLFVVPSVEIPSGDTEGQGVVLLEAFAARLCVVATRVGGISEIVEDGYTGILVESHNPQQLAATIEKLLSESKLRIELAENAYAKVKKDYGWDKIAFAFESLYRDLIHTTDNIKSHNTGA